MLDYSGYIQIKENIKKGVIHKHKKMKKNEMLWIRSNKNEIIKLTYIGENKNKVEKRRKAWLYKIEI